MEQKKRVFRTIHSPRIRVTLDCPESDRRTDSSFADETDINKIVAKYRKTRQLPASAQAAAARYGDFSQVPDFATMHQKIVAATELFQALPAKVRKEFDHDPGEFIRAAATEEGITRLKELGLGRTVEELGQGHPGALGSPQPASVGFPAPKGKAKANAKPPAAKASNQVESDQDDQD